MFFGFEKALTSFKLNNFDQTFKLTNMKSVPENALLVIFTAVISFGLFSSNGNCLKDSVSMHFVGNKRLEMALRTRKLYPSA